VTTTKAPDPLELSRVIVRNVDIAKEALRLLKVGLTIKEVFSQNVHAVFVTLFENNDGKKDGFDRIAILQEGNEWRAKKGEWPVIPLWLWAEKKG